GKEQSLFYQEEANFGGGGYIRPEPMRFAGHERDFLGSWNTDNDDQLDYMHARYYNPNQGRFLSVDPVLDVKRHLRNPQGWNRYAYVENNPINHTDPTGQCMLCVANSDCIDCRDEIAAAVKARSNTIEMQQMADAGDPVSQSIVGQGRAEGLGLGGPIDALAFGVGLRLARAAAAPAFASAPALQSHFVKHGAEFGVKSAGQYLQAARGFVSSAGQKGVQSFARANGDRVIYRAATNEFAVVTRNNVIRTYFKPKGGTEYYVRQLFEAVEQKLATAPK
ncbi:MAG TPA: RHS repeat-associated core domain-containing protein, partial [Thermoanaerobaculia bacterium]|nr:RHS repeat-associated core domain-containing protein [Thermoanaerobaculia bacterium]